MTKKLPLNVILDSKLVEDTCLLDHWSKLVECAGSARRAVCCFDDIWCWRCAVHGCRLIARHFGQWFQSTHCDLEHPRQTSPLLSSNTSLRTACVPQRQQQLEAKFDSKCQQILAAQIVTLEGRNRLIVSLWWVFLETVENIPHCPSWCEIHWNPKWESFDFHRVEPRLRKQRPIASDDLG